MMNKTNMYDNITGLTEYKTTDKINNVLNIRSMLLNKTLTMFDYQGLPESLPYTEIEKVLQLNGYGFITMYDDKLVVLNGEYYGVEKDIYNNHLKIRVFIPSKNPANITCSIWNLSANSVSLPLIFSLWLSSIYS